MSLAVLLATSTLLGTFPSAAQSTPAYDQGGAATASAPPSGQYAAPPQGAENGNVGYDDQSQQADRAYADQYSRWAARYCVDQHNNNTTAAQSSAVCWELRLGPGVAHNPGTGAAIGGAIGLGTGAAVGASQPTYGWPPGYVVATGAAAFAYTGPYWTRQ